MACLKHFISEFDQYSSFFLNILFVAESLIGLGIYKVSGKINSSFLTASVNVIAEVFNSSLTCVL